ncbi:hypothetical protein RJ640_014528 [Escallonia rubra]|uniref:Uncharacterized protein n=1 Tax=Escallonia rubra TaxID=112253 RepID=A0AA88UDF1_9ASTE|nr:hypothetical protein RJ640_014528 [Escallonia rubra]
MLSFDEGEEIFFDTEDCLLLEESVVGKEELVHNSLGYEVWKSQPQSVQERRERFLSDMGFVEFTPKHHVVHSDGLDALGLERIVECSGAVSSSCDILVDGVDKKIEGYPRELNRQANCMVDDLDQGRLGDVTVSLEKETARHTFAAEHFKHRQPHGYVDKNKNAYKKKVRSWWKNLKNMIKRNRGTHALEVLKPVAETPKVNRVNVQQNKKGCMEFSAVYVGQEFHAHEGQIWTMKFSADGQFLASGGEDGVVRIWRVTSADISCKTSSGDCNFVSQGKKGKSSPRMNRSDHASVVIPSKAFKIEELPLQEFHGHTTDVLDLAWSDSNCLLSSSKDKTVRLWQVGHDNCLGVFHHNNYVTSIQFNPVDENYFISGSIDGKVRIWGVLERRVVDWADVRDVVTAVCYQPNGKGFIVGTLTGTCRFFELSGSGLLLNTEMHINGRKKSGTKITGIQFPLGDSQRVMVTSEDSKVRIFNGIDVVHKYQGLPKSGSQMSASFVSTGRHIISVGEDSRVYVWNYDDMCNPLSKHTKSTRSCEHFFFEGVSVAIPWSGTGLEQQNGPGCDTPRCSHTQGHQKASSWGKGKDSERFSLANWFFMDGSCRGSATWPEEKLPLWDAPVEEHDCRPCSNHDEDLPRLQQHQNNSYNCRVPSATWGLVIVAAGSDGMIRAFHNYGLPVRI